MTQRIEFIGDGSRVDREVALEIARLRQVLGGVERGGPFSVMLHVPGLAQRVMETGSHLRLNSTMSADERSVVVLTVAAEQACDQVWSVHAAAARERKMPAELIESIRSRSDPAISFGTLSMIVQFVRLLVNDHRVPDDLFYALMPNGSRWMVELVGTVGQYLFVTSIVNAFELVPAPGMESPTPLDMESVTPQER